MKGAKEGHFLLIHAPADQRKGLIKSLSNIGVEAQVDNTGIYINAGTCRISIKKISRTVKKNISIMVLLNDNGVYKKMRGLIK